MRQNIIQFDQFVGKNTSQFRSMPDCPRPEVLTLNQINIVLYSSLHAVLPSCISNVDCGSKSQVAGTRSSVRIES